jgi:GH24 family phage-related lysozyme (muramidase)
MVSLAYNIGLGNYATSTVLKRHKAGQYAGAANAFLLWNKAGGKVLPGLVLRREDERSLYMGEL